MFWTRVATSTVLGPVALGTVYFGFPFFHIMVVVLGGAVLWEFVQIIGKTKLSPRIGFALLLLASCVGVATSNAAYALTLTAMTWVLLLITGNSARRFSSSSVQVGFLCATIPAITLVLVYNLGGVATMFWLLAVVWGTDIGAYICGRVVGGPKLAPVISPNKTWSGAVGGVLTAVLAAMLVDMAYAIGFQISHFVYAAIASVVSQIGDLAESRFKRQHNVKDSGTWIPGHGGVMDRVDGLWTAAPFTALVCVAVDGGVSSW